MSELIEFLRARLDEDEQVARAADEDYLLALSMHVSVAVRDAGFMQDFLPSRVLREIEAKRAILAQEEEARAHYDHIKSSATYPVETSIGHVVALATVIRHLASVYSDHPDYRDTW